MPYIFRHLPGAAGSIVDQKSIPQNTVLFNPSIAHPILYLRANRHSATDEKNFVILYDLVANKLHSIESPWADLVDNVNLFKGIEDLRICWFEHNLWFAGTCTHATNNMTSQLVIGYFDKKYTKVERISAVDIGSLPVKNMSLYVHDGKLYMLDIYLKDIYEISEETEAALAPVAGGAGVGKFVKFVATKFKKLTCGKNVDIDGLRGSTSPVHLHGNTFGCVIHDIIFNDQVTLVTRLSYLHIWIEFDAVTGSVTFASSPFWIVNWGIEYCSGMALHPDKNTVDLYLGVNDTQSATYRTTLHDLRCGK